MSCIPVLDADRPPSAKRAGRCCSYSDFPISRQEVGSGKGREAVRAAFEISFPCELCGAHGSERDVPDSRPICEGILFLRVPEESARLGRPAVPPGLDTFSISRRDDSSKCHAL